MPEGSLPTYLLNQIAVDNLDFPRASGGGAKDQPTDRSIRNVLKTYLLEQQIERLIRVESAKRRYMPRITEDAIDWAILLDLTRAELRNETVYSGVLRSSLALRELEFWSGLARLEERGLLNGMYVPSNSCRIAIWLTEYGAELMTRVLAPL